MPHLFSWFRRRRWEGRMDAELRFHLDSQIGDYVAQGLSRADAELRAQREFGALELAKDECRDEKPAGWLDGFSRDVRYAVRALRKSPGFTVAAILTLALGIGANTAIFQLLDAVRLRTLPIPDPQRLALVQLASRTGQRGSQATQYPALTNPQWERFRDTQDVFSGVLAWWTNEFGLTATADNRTARGLIVNGDFFRVLGVRPLLGRTFSAEDDRRGCGLPGAVISYAFWQREFGGDPAVIGRKLVLNYQPVEIIGVTPAGFVGLEIGRAYDVAVPICSQAALWNEGNWLDRGTVWWLVVMGRMKPGWTLEQTRAQLQATSPAIFQATLPANYPAVSIKDYLKLKLTAVPARSGVSGLREEYGEPLLLLFATAGLVLLIACANLANLMLARATSREHEFAVRLAIGASRGRLIRQLMVESGMLAAAGAAAGLLLSVLLSSFLVAMLGTEGDPLFLDLRPDVRMLAFTAAIAGLTCLLFGLTPALRATRGAAGDALRSSRRTLSATRERMGLRQVLVVAQVALTVVLLAGALLFSGSLRNLLSVDAGFQHQGVLIASIDLARPMKIPAAQRPAFKRELLQRIRAVPGVVAAAESDIVPLRGDSTGNAVWMEGADSNRKYDARFHWISDGYIRTMAMTLIAGRDFNDRDTAASPKVALVNASFVRRLGITGNPIGQKFRREATPSEPETTFEIVGLVNDTKYLSLREDFAPIAFLSTAQVAEPGPWDQLMIRSSAGRTETAAAVRRAVAQIRPDARMDFRSFENTVREGLLRERLMATLSGFFGILAVLIATVGLYGVLSYLVVRRTNEIGVRIALGAGRRSIMALVLGQAGVLLAVGLAVGLGLSLAVTGAARSLLFGLAPSDARTLGLAVILLAAIAAIASYLPARRAARLEPMTALREE